MSLLLPIMIPKCFKVTLGCGKEEKSNHSGVVVVVVWWCGFITDYNTTLGLHWVTLGCGKKNIDNKNIGHKEQIIMI